MNRRIRNLWVKGLQGSADAYYRLGISFLTGQGCRKDRKLARLCLKRSAELGSEDGYLCYHRIFSKGKKVIDDSSYRQMYKEYTREPDQEERRRLREYLSLGTIWQKQKL